MNFDNKITYAVLFAVLIEAAAGMFWTGRAAARLEAVERRLAITEPMAERLARVEEQVRETREGVVRIEAKLERRR